MSSKSQLIPIFTGKINNYTVQFVDARILHEFLEIARDFSTWFKKRIQDYGFIKNQDYLEFYPKICSSIHGGRPSKNYHLTLDMAKELSMVERNDKGKAARRYFIDCEMQLHNKTVSQHINPIKNNTIGIEELVAKYESHTNALEDLKNSKLIFTIEASNFFNENFDFKQTIMDQIGNKTFQSMFQKPSRKNHKWLTEEKLLLQKYLHQNLNDLQIAMKINRTPNGVRYAIKKYLCN